MIDTHVLQPFENVINLLKKNLFFLVTSIKNPLISACTKKGFDNNKITKSMKT